MQKLLAPPMVAIDLEMYHNAEEQDISGEEKETEQQSVQI